MKKKLPNKYKLNGGFFYNDDSLKILKSKEFVKKYQNKIDLVINTTEKKQAIIDSFTIRRTSVDLNIPYYTNLRSAEILIKSLIILKNKPISVNPIQIHHSF